MFIHFVKLHRFKSNAFKNILGQTPKCCYLNVCVCVCVRFRDGRLHAGDELLMINGQSLVGLTHQEAVAILRSTTGLVQLVVASRVNAPPPPPPPPPPHTHTHTHTDPKVKSTCTRRYSKKKTSTVASFRNIANVTLVQLDTRPS
uniref:PDZ domain-containing protein n=1 Tax=Cyclopterus lumpus TaxID=8103 RepID=A0A8C2WSY7_CYCLU